MSLVILNYQLLKESVESEFTISFDLFKNSNINYVLKYPSNPILDCVIINLHEESLQKVFLNITKLIEEDEYGLTTRIKFIQFHNWLSKVVKLLTNEIVSIQ